jgi:phage portal protein BeeE
MKSLAMVDGSWTDDAWTKKVRSLAKPADGGGVFPRALSTATVQYNMRQVPQRGMAEMLESYRSNPWLHRCIDIIGGKFGEVPWQLFARPNAQTGKRMPIGKYMRFKGAFRHKNLMKAVDTGELKEIENHPLLDLWENPNGVMSGVLLRDLMAKYLKMQGECFIYKRRDVNGIVYQLWPLPPTWIYRVPTENAPFFDVSVIGRTMRVPSEDMMWLKFPELLNPYTRGAGQGESMGSYIDSDHYAMEFQKSYFYNDARPNMFIHMAGASAQVVDDFKNKLDNANRGPLRSHRPLIYEGPDALGIQEIDVSKGMDAAIPLLQHDRDTFLSVFGIPPEVAGVLGSSNRATITVAETIMARHVTAPLCEFVADELNRDLVFEFDQGEGKILFTYENPVPADADFQLEVLTKAPWAASTNEWRALGGLPSRGAKDDFYMVPSLFTPTDDPSKPVVPMAPHKIADLNPAQKTNQVMGENGSPKPGSLQDPQSGVGSEQDGAGDDDQEAPNGGKSLKKKPIIPDYYAVVSKASGDLTASDLPSYTRVKDARIKRVIGAVKPKAINAELDPVWKDKVKEWGDVAMADVGVKPAFDMYNENVATHLEDFSSDRITLVNDTTRDAIAKALSEGVDAGEGIPDLQKRIEDVFFFCDETRSALIARTEVTRSANFASMAGYKQSGLVDKKVWIATPGDITRDTHKELGGRDPIPIDDPFEIDGEEAQQPGDFGVPEEDCNCRCAVAPVVNDVDDEDMRPEDLADEADPDSKDIMNFRPNPEDMHNGKWAFKSLSTAGISRMPKDMIWKRFDAGVTKWEVEAEKALRKAFAAQRKAALAALA